MISVLIVEDDARKADEIKEVIAHVSKQCEITMRDNVHEASQVLRDAAVDLLIVDMLIPMRAGDEPEPNAGVELLRQIRSLRDYHIPQHVIGLTAFEALADAHAEVFDQFTWALIKYSPGEDAWRQRIIRKVEHIFNWKQIEVSGHGEFDLAIVVALEEPELTAILNIEDNTWNRFTVRNDDSFYYRSKYESDGKQLSVVAASAIQVGMPAATGLAMKLVANFHPKYLGLAGICAGVDGNFGDILIADKTWDYGSGKSKGSLDADTGNVHDEFSPAPTAIPLDAELLEKFKSFARRQEVIARAESLWTGRRPQVRPQVKLGPIASGAAVLQNRPLIEEIRSHDRKLVGVEMEAYGVFLAARVCSGPRPKPFVVKSVCDFADPTKTDDYQSYAAHMSARYIREFALAELC
jgi:nucleoside phosphorylase/CheY-like chemotaxis protein